MTFTRRNAMKLTAATLAGVGLGLGGAGRALALTADEAEAFVSKLVAEVTQLLDSGKPISEQAKDFSKIFARYAALPQITRFVMGQTWRTMSEAQQKAAQDALVSYVGRIYSSLLKDYNGQTLSVTKAQDFGAKGVLVTTVATGKDVENSVVEWQISDRAGHGPQVVDLVAEGVSLLQNQRQEFAAMLEKRGGNVDKFIADLAAGRTGEG